MKELVLKKCMKCGAVVEVLHDCNCGDCGIRCCEEEMKVLVPNTVDAAAEKHVPTYEVVGDRIVVTVNHVMEEDHFIEWIALVAEDRIAKKYPIGEAKCDFPYIPGSKVYSYCNKHDLWMTEIK